VLRLAAHLLEVRPEDLESADGALRVRGAPGRSIPLAEVARQAYLAHRLPPGDEPGLEERAGYDPVDFTYACGFDVATVDVDRATGDLRILRYAAVHDCGVQINPAVVEGQILGGLAQGLGGALYEELDYDRETGQLLTGTFMDYLLPSATEMPAELRFAQLCTPSTISPTGVKGTGEGGIIPPAPAVANAVAAATGSEPLTLPLRPEELARL
jgi:carbon-monoxide dehydrogenase large subunit